MLTKRQKRRTQQVRVDWEVHRALKMLAAKRRVTVSRLIDEMIGENAPEVRKEIKKMRKEEKQIKALGIKQGETISKPNRPVNQ